MYIYLAKKETLHVLDTKLPNLTQSYFFKKYVNMKGACQTRQPRKNVSKLIKRKRMKLKKRKTAFCRLVG